MPFEHLVLELFGVLFVGLLLGALDQRQDIAHAEDALGEPVRIERLERVGLFAGADELDRHAGDGADRKRRAAAGVAIHLGQDQAGDAEPLVEGLAATGPLPDRSSRRRPAEFRSA